jgi:hypothetical protein
MQLFAILAVLVAANFGAVYYGSDMLEDDNGEPKGIVEVQEEAVEETELAPEAVITQDPLPKN